MLIINAKVWTMAGKTYENGFIQFLDGKIQEVGEMSRCPQDEVCYDAEGAVAVPGFIDAHCHIGMWEDGMGFEGDDGNEDTDPITPQLRGIDGVNPMDRAFKEALDYGVTTVVTGPGSANPIAGQLCALKTMGRRVDKLVVREPLAIKMAFGENPKNTYHEKDTGPVTRMAVAALVREQLTKARKYLEQMEKAQTEEDEEEPEYDQKCEALIPLLSGQVKAHIHAHRADDIFTGIRIAKEFGFGYVIVHGTEAHLIQEELLEEQAAVICGPLIGARTKPELAQASIQGPGLLSGAGIPVAICTDHPEIPCHYLLMSAQLAWHNGMDREKALEAITIQAARICGLEERVGSLEAGKDGDVLLFAQDPMETHRPPKAVFLDGKQVR